MFQGPVQRDLVKPFRAFYHHRVSHGRSVALDLSFASAADLGGI